MSKVVVAMSGGVDSSVAAALLKEQGHEVTGLMLRLWSEPGREADNRCCTPEALGLARRVAARLEIPFYVLDAGTVFRERVVAAFLQGYADGLTPNPCLVCNREVRWGFLLEHARALGAEKLATGHYARVASSGGRTALLRAVDRRKDQSYVLHLLDQAQLECSLFPLGSHTKEQVRALARSFRLPTAVRPDSQDLCFLGGADYRDFYLRHAARPPVPGPIVRRDGTPLGQHDGLAFFTIGQRKGLGVHSPEPLYVLEKDPRTNTLVVGSREELGRRRLVAEGVHWIDGTAPGGRARVEVKTRYTAAPAWAEIQALAEGGQVEVEFEEPQRDLTPGQSAVFYDGERVLGGGRIR